MRSARQVGFGLAARTPLREYLYHRYDYSFSPHQLGFLVDCLDPTADVEDTVHLILSDRRRSVPSVKAALELITPRLSPGGAIVVDDCQPHPLWDGALQAY